MKGAGQGLGLLLAVCALSAAIAATPAGETAAPQLPNDQIESVRITVDPWRDGQDAVDISSSEASGVRALADLVRSAVLGEDHKCSNVGTVEFQMSNAGVVKLGILPGHDPSVYQYRFYSGEGYTVFHVPREAFLEALAQLGVPVNEQGFPQ
jgi:hypothetical protein